MYYLDDRVTPTGLVTYQPDFFLLWYWHLVHLSVQNLQSVVPIESSVSILDCESCKLGKHHHGTYLSRVNNRNSSAFELVYSDVWSPVVCLQLKSLDIFSFLLMTSLV